MKTSWLLAAAAILAGCTGRNQDQAAVVFQTMELRQIDAPNPKPRSVFLKDERPIIFMDGRKTWGREMFVELQFNGEGSNVSPTYTGQVGGKWTYMGHGDLLPGDYHATLYVDGKPSAWTDFKIIK